MDGVGFVQGPRGLCDDLMRSLVGIFTLYVLINVITLMLGIRSLYLFSFFGGFFYVTKTITFVVGRFE